MRTGMAGSRPLSGDPHGASRQPRRGESGEGSCHVLLVTHYFSTHRGGVELIAAALARQLVVAKGWTITWMASDADRNPENLPATVQTLPATSWNGLERRLGVPWPVWSPWSLVPLWREVGRAGVP